MARGETRSRAIDVHVGSRIRLRRDLLGMSQQSLGDALGLTFQQVQKYERGSNRVGASRLFDLSQVLDVPISFFFDDMPDSLTRTYADHASRQPRNGAAPEVLIRHKTLQLIGAYYRIRDPELRKRILALIKSMGGGPVET